MNLAAASLDAPHRRRPSHDADAQGLAAAAWRVFHSAHPRRRFPIRFRHGGQTFKVWGSNLGSIRITDARGRPAVTR